MNCTREAHAVICPVLVFRARKAKFCHCYIAVIILLSSSLLLLLLLLYICLSWAHNIQSKQIDVNTAAGERNIYVAYIGCLGVAGCRQTCTCDKCLLTLIANRATFHHIYPWADLLRIPFSRIFKYRTLWIILWLRKQASNFNITPKMDFAHLELFE